MKKLAIKKAQTENDIFFYFDLNKNLSLAYSKKEDVIFLNDNKKGQLTDDLQIGGFLLRKNLLHRYVDFKFSLKELGIREEV